MAKKKIEHPGKYFKNLCKKEGITIAELSRILDHPYQTVWQFLNGKQRLMPELSIKLAIVFPLETDIFTTGGIYLNWQDQYDLSKIKKIDVHDISTRFLSRKII